MDLLARTAALVDIPSVSLDEGIIADLVERDLRALSWVEVHRIGHNVVARTRLGRPSRLVLAGHLDTVPPDDNERARREGDVVWGCGSSDMKGGLAVLLELAAAVPEPEVDLTFVFYAGEEADAKYNGLAELFDQHREFVQGDVALLAEPTDGAIEAGCQGTMRVELTLRGERSHTARPWMGRNAIHRLGPLLVHLEERQDWRRVEVDGCEYREAVSAVLISGGVAANVVPDSVVVTLNHRYAPDRTREEAEAALRSALGEIIEPTDGWRVVDHAGAARPGLDHPLLAALVSRNGLEVRAKLGWTDVARFSAAGIPASNFGPGDPLLAHTKDEWVSGDRLQRCFDALHDLVTNAPR